MQSMLLLKVVLLETPRPWHMTYYSSTTSMKAQPLQQYF